MQAYLRSNDWRIDLPGSGTPEILDLVHLSNHDINGSFVFRVDETVGTNETLECAFGKFCFCFYLFIFWFDEYGYVTVGPRQ